jgi:hypothetical protein
MPTIEQCRTYAAEYKVLGNDRQIAARRSTVLLSISRSWTALANQLENLTVIVKDKKKEGRLCCRGIANPTCDVACWHFSDLKGPADDVCS